ncbi:MAG: NlpC/P60 family protein [Candidatus Wallbacteria bacterium]|nr:NlpC/P60 family protein [Candidatus Wallbacteria bacterium]
MTKMFFRRITMVLMLFFIAAAIKSFAAQNPAQFKQFPIKIPKLSEEMLYPEFWISRLADPDQILDSELSIRMRNRNNLKEADGLENMSQLPVSYSSAEVLSMIEENSAVSKKPRFLNGSTVEASFYDRILKNRNISGIKEQNPVRFGITVRRTEMRMLPTPERIFNDPVDMDFDRILTTGIYPLEPVAVFHESLDGKWFLAKCSYCMSWIPAEDVALGSRLQIMDFARAEPFLVVTGKKIFTSVDLSDSRLSEQQLDMGIKIPLARPGQITAEVEGRIPEGNFVVRYPVREPDGTVAFLLAMIQRSEDVSIGYIPYTRRNIILQAFKFLGQRYSWGGIFNTRDCSAFSRDILATMGVKLPRNSRFQGQLAPAQTIAFPDNSTLETRISILQTVTPCSFVYMSGHVMLYLGKFRDDYFIIHDTTSLKIKLESGDFQSFTAMGVIITPLLSTFLGNGKPFLEGLYAARNFISLP